MQLSLDEFKIGQVAAGSGLVVGGVEGVSEGLLVLRRCNAGGRRGEQAACACHSLTSRLTVSGGCVDGSGEHFGSVYSSVLLMVFTVGHQEWLRYRLVEGEVQNLGLGNFKNH